MWKFSLIKLVSCLEYYFEEDFIKLICCVSWHPSVVVIGDEDDWKESTEQHDCNEDSTDDEADAPVLLDVLCGIVCTLRAYNCLKITIGRVKSVSSTDTLTATAHRFRETAAILPVTDTHANHLARLHVALD